MGDLAHEVSLCVRYYSVTFRGAKPERCILAGGEASEPRLAECFQDALHLSTGVGRPLDSIASGGRASARVRGSGVEWASAVGLSLRARDDVKKRRRAQARRGPEAPARGTVRPPETRAAA
jgi:Tfp pilus assembly PilM family ATPase